MRQPRVASALLALALALPAAPAAAGGEEPSLSALPPSRLKVRAEHVESDMGMVRVEVYEDADAFTGTRTAEPLREQVLPAAPGRVTAVFDDLPPGRYAVRVMHDENNNGVLDRVFGLFTLEGQGVSNNQPPRAALFDKSAFVLPVGDTVTVAVTLTY